MKLMSFLPKTTLLAAFTLPLLLGACASTQDLNDLKAQVAKAQSTADEALTEAKAASAKADDASAKAEAASEKADQVFQKSLRK